MNRRDFLVTSATAAAALSARSYARILGANDRVGLGVIGLGRRGTIVTDAFLHDGRTRLVALSDVYDAQIERFLARYATDAARLPTFVAYQDLIARPDVDAVLIATPDHLHVTIAKDALDASKHVYLEKPTLHQWQDRSTLTEAAQQSKTVVQCGMQQRSGEHYQRAKEKIFDSNRLGKVVFARAVWNNFPWQQRHIAAAAKPPGLDWDRFLGPAPHVSYETVRYTAWRYFPAYGNGLLADILTHWADVAQWMLDDAHPRAVTSLGGIYELHDQRRNPDTVNAIVQYGNWNLSFESSVLSIRDDRPSVFFEGTEGTLDLSRDGYIFTPNEGSPQTVAAAEPLEQAHARNFLDAIVRGSTVNAPLSAGIDASRPVQMALRSYWSRKTVLSEEFS